MLTSRALLARVVSFKDADRICELLTEELGRVPVMARGARRSRRRFGGALSLFVIGEATLARSGRRGGGMLTLQQFDCVEDLGAALCADVVAMAHGSYMLELARELWPEAQPEPGLFALVCDALRALSRERPSPSLLRAFELQVLDRVGLAPALSRCVACDDTLQGDAPARFSVSRGGILCRRCEGPVDDALSPAARQHLLAMSAIPLASAFPREPGPDAAREARDLMLRVVHHQLGKTLKSLSFILQLRGN